jgi:type IV pilus assembly protein PilE
VKRQQQGVTLLELMAVVVILGILASIAIPSYRGYVMRAQRSEATAFLLRAAAAQEKYYLQNNSYTDVFAGTGGTSLKLLATGADKTENGWYAVTIAAGSTGSLASSYLITTTAVSGKSQAKDTPCQSFTIRETGERGSSPSNAATCWR